MGWAGGFPGNGGVCRAGSRPVQQMPMHLSDFDGDAYITVCIGQILVFNIIMIMLLKIEYFLCLAYHFVYNLYSSEF